MVQAADFGNSTKSPVDVTNPTCLLVSLAYSLPQSSGFDVISLTVFPVPPIACVVVVVVSDYPLPWFQSLSRQA